jgi:RimJ/RimL family protein N-acetyltransferase
MPADSDYLVRPFVAADAPSFFAAVQASLPELVYWMPWCKPDYSLDDAVAWLCFAEEAWQKKTDFPLGIFHVSTGAVVGGTGVNHINKAFHFGNVGYWVSSAHTGRGVARFAARQAVGLAFGELGLTRVEIAVLPQNIASHKVAQSLGATCECTARNRLYFQGRPHDAVVYSLVPGDLG